MLLRKGVLKICSKFTGEYPCRSAISIKLQKNFTEITLRHGSAPLNLLHIFRTPFPENTSGRRLLICQKALSDNSEHLRNVIATYFQILTMEEKNVEKVLKSEQIQLL